MKHLSKNELQKLEKAADIVYATQTIYADTCSTAFPSVQEQGKFFSQATRPSQVYLSNFENSYKMGPILGTSEFMSHPGHMACLFNIQDKEDTSQTLPIPKPRRLSMSLQKAIMQRASVRMFSHQALDTQTLSDFLFYTAGVTKQKPTTVCDIEITRSYRPFPSGGGMYATQLYLAMYHVAGIAEGMYIYQPHSHTLRPAGPIVPLDTFMVTKRYDPQTASYVAIEGLYPAVLLLCVHNFTMPRLKYGELSLALGYTDCGCMLQNASLLATALDVGFCVWAGFKKAAAEHALGLDGLDRHVIMTALLGRKES